MKILCDLRIFRSLPSGSGFFYEPRLNQYCAQGKLLKSCGYEVEIADLPTINGWLSPLGRSPFRLGNEWDGWDEIARLNNEGDFAAADQLVLELAYTSGKIDFINGLPDAPDAFDSAPYLVLTPSSLTCLVDSLGSSDGN